MSIKHDFIYLFVLLIYFKFRICEQKVTEVTLDEMKHTTLRCIIQSTYIRCTNKCVTQWPLSYEKRWDE